MVGSRGVVICWVVILLVVELMSTKDSFFRALSVPGRDFSGLNLSDDVRFVFDVQPCIDPLRFHVFIEASLLDSSGEVLGSGVLRMESDDITSLHDVDSRTSGLFFGWLKGFCVGLVNPQVSGDILFRP